jgi:hypothetical protein
LYSLQGMAAFDTFIFIDRHDISSQNITG